MAGLKFALGLIPKTEKVEEKDLKIRSDYKRYKEIEKSSDLARYIELERYINSIEFENRKKEILTKKFKHTEEYSREVEFKKLEKSKSIRNYFKVKDSNQLTQYHSFLKSDLLKRIKELDNYIKSDAIPKAKARLSPKEYKKSEEAAKEKEYIQLVKSPQVKKNKKFENSKKYREFKRIESSDLLKHYQELKEYINTKKFKDYKEYMNMSGKKKFELSDQYKQLSEYNDLKDSEKITWFFKTKKKYPFGELEKWNLVFEDDFTEPKPDSKKWMFRYINGERTIKKPYVLADDIHAFTDGKNIEINSGYLTIVTRKEQAGCMVWNPLTGFTESEYEYTSDLASTGGRFEFKNGLLTAKVKSGASSVTQAFSLMSDKMLPHVDVFKLEKKKLYAGNYWKNGNAVEKSVTKTGGNKFTNNYFIFSLEWTPEKLIWKINDLVFKEERRGIPDTNMHIVFNSSLKKDSKTFGIPSKMGIDWVRVYEKVK